MSMSTDERHPAISVDLVVLTILDDALHVLLVKRRNEPFAGCWSLPGGRAHIEESLEDAARRVLNEKTGISRIFLEQLYTFGEPNRDPRQRIITIAYYALIPFDTTTVLHAGHAEQDIAWAPVATLGCLAFDHEMIIEATLQRLRNKLDYTPVGLELLPEKFTLSELQRVYEIILGKTIDKRNFRKKIRGKDWIERTEGFRRDGPHRPAQLYRFVPRSTPNGSYL
ncbi:MAG TPA: NUDIX hydrolase [Firmicutes bacterium]|nr:NUDIX hydrolase [Bacillota bacterium]